MSLAIASQPFWAAPPPHLDKILFYLFFFVEPSLSTKRKRQESKIAGEIRRKLKCSQVWCSRLACYLCYPGPASHHHDVGIEKNRIVRKIKQKQRQKPKQLKIKYQICKSFAQSRPIHIAKDRTIFEFHSELETLTQSSTALPFHFLYGSVWLRQWSKYFAVTKDIVFYAVSALGNFNV